MAYACISISEDINECHSSKTRDKYLLKCHRQELMNLKIKILSTLNWDINHYTFVGIIYNFI